MLYNLFLNDELEKNDMKIYRSEEVTWSWQWLFLCCAVLKKSTIILLFYEYINKRHFNFVLDENVKVKKDE